MWEKFALISLQKPFKKEATAKAASFWHKKARLDFSSLAEKRLGNDDVDDPIFDHNHLFDGVTIGVGFDFR